MEKPTTYRLYVIRVGKSDWELIGEFTSNPSDDVIRKLIADATVNEIMVLNPGYSLSV